LLALVWSLDERPRATTHRICADRVLARGTNHQSLHGDAAAKAHEEVIWQFLQGTEELGDKEVDDVVEMDVGEDLEDALDRALDGVVHALGLPKPDSEAVGAALAAARGYVPDSVDAKPFKTVSPRFYGLLPELDLGAALPPLLDSDSAPPSMRTFWKELKEARRIAERPHITLVHQKTRDTQPELWDRCAALHTAAAPPMFRARLARVLCDGRAMALAVQDLAVDSEADDGEGQAGAVFISTLPADVYKRLHVTVGTRGADVPPVEAKVLVERWNCGERDGIECVEVPETLVLGRVKGLMN
jgi:tRNA ligase